MNPRLYSFCGGDSGAWQVTSQSTVTGDALSAVARLDVSAGWCEAKPRGFALHAVASNERYVTQAERAALAGVQETLGRPNSIHAVLIGIRKSDDWWGLAVDARRTIMEQRSHHIEIGARYLPQIARRLHHCRDLASAEPFDFVTWFEFADEHEGMFDQLLVALRSSEEWNYVTREVELRMTRASTRHPDARNGSGEQ